MRVVPVKFSLAKSFYNLYHRTNLAPQGHKLSFVALDGDDWNYIGLTEELFDDLYEQEENEDIIHRQCELDICKDGSYKVIDGGRFTAWVTFTRGKVLGVCSIGNPVARFKEKVNEITRICFPDYFVAKSNKEKKYYSKFIRESLKQYKEFYSFDKMVTYIHQNQSGKYLEYAGFVKDKLIKYSENSIGWSNRDGRTKRKPVNKYRYIWRNNHDR